MTRNLFLQAIVVVGTAASLVNAAPTGVLLIEQTYSVWGNAGLPVADTYSESGSAAVTGSASALSSDGILNTATSSAGPDGLSAFRSGNANAADAYAQSEYRFTPDYSRLVLNLSGTIGEWAFENRATMTLIDVTAGVEVDSYATPHLMSELDPTTIGGFDFDVRFDFAVDPSHIYSLVGLVEAHRAEGGTGSADMSIGFSSVIPAPPALLLAALGAGLVT
ncbi:MAG: hypothetical protein ACM3VT_09985, partial [Solirubrobacterales bacterium]